MYKVQDEIFASFSKAVAIAKQIGCDVIEMDTGLRRWTPAQKVSKKRLRQYREQKNAFEAQAFCYECQQNQDAI